MSENDSRPVTLDQVQAITTISQYESARESYLESNPDLDSSEVRTFLDSAAAQAAREEITQHGRIVSNPREIFKKSAEKLNQFGQKAEERAKAKSAQETSQQSKTEDHDSNMVESNEQYAKRQRNRARQLRGFPPME